MTYAAPGRLWLLVLPLLLAAAYVVAQRARRRAAVRFTNVELLASIAPRRPGWRRHLPAAAMVLALLSLVVGFARPERDVRVPKERATVILALDVSTSMAAEDVQPNRLAAAQQAARSFTDDLPRRLRLGLVVFSGFAQVMVPPTTDRDAVREAIDSLQLTQRTAIGEAIFASLDALRVDERDDGGVRTPAHIVLMSDGTTTSGRPNAEAAAAAVEAGVPVTTIAYGTDSGVIELNGQLVPVPVDRAALADISSATGGGTFEAASGDELRDVYETIGSAVGYDVERRDVTAFFVGLALVAMTLAAAGSLLWMGRLP